MDFSEFKILIVDDEQDLLEVCVDAFEMEDFKVVTAENGQEAIELINSADDVKVIVSDSSMPVMNGLDLLKEVTKIPQDVRPLFYLSTGDIDLTEQDIKSQGGTGLVPKPYDVDELISRIVSDLKALKQAA